LKIPRDVSGEDLTRALKRLGYEKTRQSGSHIRLTYQAQGKEHHVTVPAHKQLTVGTLGQILSDVATNLSISRDDLIEQLFG
jgi:predicted RNA binding protein YcfA (HicA-like mRNA interferase family)